LRRNCVENSWMPSHLGLGDRFFSREGGITLLIKISHYAGFFVIL